MPDTSRQSTIENFLMGAPDLHGALLDNELTIRTIAVGTASDIFVNTKDEVDISKYTVYLCFL